MKIVMMVPVRGLSTNKQHSNDNHLGLTFVNTEP